jgi:hypothetical protein
MRNVEFLFHADAAVTREDFILFVAVKTSVFKIRRRLKETMVNKLGSSLVRNVCLDSFVVTVNLPSGSCFDVA